MSPVCNHNRLDHILPLTSECWSMKAEADLVSAGRALLIEAILCIVAWWRHMTSWIFVNIGSGYDLLFDVTKPKAEHMYMYRQIGQRQIL